MSFSIECFLFVKNLFSNCRRPIFEGGIIKFPKKNEINDRINAEKIKGSKNLLKLIPLLNIEIISELLAIFEVKKMTDTKIKSGLKRFPK